VDAPGTHADRRSNRHRHIATAVAACTLLGVATAVAVAWTTIAIGHKLTGLTVQYPDRVVADSRGFGGQRRIRVLQIEIPGNPAGRPPAWWPSAIRLADAHGATLYSAHAAGWPFNALRSVTVKAPDATAEHAVGAMHVSLFGRRMLLLPTIPIAAGLAADTAIYAALWFVLAWLAPKRVRLALRRRRGACPHCGYDVRALNITVCPECGCDLR